MNDEIPELKLDSYAWVDRNGNVYASDSEYYESLEEDNS